jgi:hypothetical protein
MGDKTYRGRFAAWAEQFGMRDTIAGQEEQLLKVGPWAPLWLGGYAAIPGPDVRARTLVRACGQVLLDALSAFPKPYQDRAAYNRIVLIAAA